jgi:alpha-L-rhamnosidase
MGLLHPEAWQAAWISPGFDAVQQETPPPAPYLRRPFAITAPVATARLSITSLGLYEAWLNGVRVGDAWLTPGWTSYHSRVLVQTYDVTQLLGPGENVLGAILGEGWYRGRIGAVGGRRYGYGERLALIAQLELRHPDGARTVIVSDEFWRAATGPILQAGLYDGETYDARREEPGWCRAGFDDGHWQPVALLAHPLTVLQPDAGPWVRRTDELQPVTCSQGANGTRIFDFGQNMTGWTRLQATGASGSRITVRHGEVLEPDGSLHTANLRTARQTEQWVLQGKGDEAFEPHFTFHGFRYAEVSAEPAWPEQLALTGVVIHSDLATTGSFACSDARLNRLQRNIVWGQRGNFVDIPTDCPQRDERLGWGGDLQLFAQTACFNMDCSRFLTKWLHDLLLDQHPDGAFPNSAPLSPSVLDDFRRGGAEPPPFHLQPGFGAAGYADAGVLVPWALYLNYGDQRILEECYAGMVRWVAWVQEKAGDSGIWEGWFQFGDWLALDAPTIPDLAATACFARSARVLGQVAEILGHHDDAARYDALWRAVAAAFRRRFGKEDGRLQPASQSAYVLALAFDLLEAQERPAAARRLVADIRARGNHLSTGFLGTPFLCHVLAGAGYLDVAYDLLLQESFPSWLYPLTQGATTIWERWNGVEPGGALFHPAMNSFNHYAYGAIGEFLYTTVAGLEVDPSHPGYQHFRVRPQPGGGLTWAQATRKTLYGQVESTWRIVDGRFQLEVTAPPNTSARITLPTRDSVETLLCDGATQVIQTPLGLVVEVGAGRHCFDVGYAALPAHPSPEPAADYHFPRFSIFTSVGGILDHATAYEVVAQRVMDMPRLDAILRRRRMYSLHQLAAFAPELLTPAVLSQIDDDLRTIEKGAGH